MATERKDSNTEIDGEKPFANKGELLAYFRGLQEGREEANKKARNTVTLITPQLIAMRNKEAKTRLENPKQIVTRKAHDIVSHYFHIARVLMGDEGTTKSHRAWAEQEVLLCLRAWDLPPEDNKRNRRATFLMNFVHALRDHEIFMHANKADYSKYLPKDPHEAKLKRQEIERLRARSRRNLPPQLAAQIVRNFLTIYPDEQGKFDLDKLAEAIEAHAAEEGKRQGRKPIGKVSKNKLLADAIGGTSFAAKETAIKEAIKIAKKKSQARLEEARKRHKESEGEMWEPPSFDPRKFDE